MNRWICRSAATIVFLSSTMIAANAGAADATQPPPPSSTSDAAIANRHGFTLEMGLGLAYTDLEASLGDHPLAEHRLGFAPISVGLGAFLSPRFALVARAAGTAYTRDGNEFVNGFYGVTAQYWLDPSLFVGAGVGLAGFAQISGDHSGAVRGLGTNARFGYAFDAGPHHVFALSVDVFPSFYDHLTVVGSALSLSWQWF